MPVIFSPEDAARRIDELLKQTQAPAILQAIGYTIIALFFLLHLYRAVMNGDPRLVVEGLLRTAIAGALVRNYPLIVNVAVDWFAGMSSLGTYVQDALGSWGQVDALRAQLDRIIALLTQGFGVGSTWDKIANLGTYIIYAFSVTAVHVLFALFFVVTVLIFNFLVFMAMVTMVIAALLAPLVLATPSSRFLQPFMWEWMQVVLHAGLVIFIAQAIMGVVVNQAVVKPIQEFADNLAAAQASGDINMALAAVKMPITALVGLGVGVFALLNVQGIASSFVGRVESVAGATAAAMFMAMGATRLASAAARFGGRAGTHLPVPTFPPPSPPGGGGSGGGGPGGGGGGRGGGGPRQPVPVGVRASGGGTFDINEAIPGARSYEPDPPSPN